MSMSPFLVTNPVNEALRGYNMMDEIMARQEDRAQAQEDRKQQQIDKGRRQARENQLFNQQQQDREQAQAWQNETRGRQRDEQANQDEIRMLRGVQASLLRISDLATAGAKTEEEAAQRRAQGYDKFLKSLPPEQQNKVWSLLSGDATFGTPEGITKTKQAVTALDTAVATIANQQLPPDQREAAKASALQSLNTLYANQLNKGGGKGIVGPAQKEIVDATVTQNGIVFTLAISGKDKDNKPVQYQEVVTDNREPGDQNVRTYDIGKLLANAQHQGTLADVMQMRLAQLGDANAVQSMQGQHDELMKKAQQEKLGLSYGGLVGLSADEQKSLQQIVSAGGKAKDVADFLVKMHAIDAKNATGTKAGRDSKGGGSETKMPDHILKTFEIPGGIGSDGSVQDKSVDVGRLNDFIAFKSRFGHDMSYEDAYAQFLQEEAAAPGGAAGKDSNVNNKEREISEDEVNDRVTVLNRLRESGKQEESMKLLEQLKDDPAMLSAVTRRLKEEEEQKETIRRHGGMRYGWEDNADRLMAETTNNPNPGVIDKIGNAWKNRERGSMAKPMPPSQTSVNQQALYRDFDTAVKALSASGEGARMLDAVKESFHGRYALNNAESLKAFASLYPQQAKQIIEAAKTLTNK